MANEQRWYWYAGYAGDVECEGLYALGDFRTRAEAVAEGQANMPDIDGNHFFHIIEARLEPDPAEDILSGFVPFGATRNREIINVEPPRHG